MKTEILSKLASVHLLTARRALAAFLFVFLAALSLCLWFDFTIATHPWLSWTAVMITLFFVPTFA